MKLQGVAASSGSRAAAVLAALNLSDELVGLHRAGGVTWRLAARCTKNCWYAGCGCTPVHLPADRTRSSRKCLSPPPELSVRVSTDDAGTEVLPQKVALRGALRESSEAKWGCR
jgi:hypothetical protein